MNLEDLYQYLLLLVASILTFIQYQKYELSTYDSTAANTLKTEYIGIALCVFFTLLIGLRPLQFAWQFGDSSAYKLSYRALAGRTFILNLSTTNIIWDNLFKYWASHRIGLSYLFLLSDALYFGCTYLACRKWFPNDTLPAYLVFLGAFSTYSYSNNGVKAGIAASIFLLGLAYYEKKWVSIILVLVSWGFHHSMQLPVAVYVLTFFWRNPKWYFYFWAFCAVMSILHIEVFAGIFAGMSDKSGAKYLTEHGRDSYLTGFRPDFLIYSAMPVWIGYRLVMKDGLEISKTYSLLLRIYLLTNGVWLLCMYASFTNRIAYLSWFMYPFVLIYPFLKDDLHESAFLGGNDQHSMFAKIMAYHLCFTLFMELIYYKFLH